MKKANLPVRAEEWENEREGGSEIEREREREWNIPLEPLCV